jgi:hypothetical protein
MASGTISKPDEPENQPTVSTDGKVVVFLFIMGFFLLGALILGELILKFLP